MVRLVEECAFFNIECIFFYIEPPQMKMLMVVSPCDSLFQDITVPSKKKKAEAVALNCTNMGKSDMVIKVDV